MTEIPILFKGSMVRAILDGKKTQTRRIIKPQPEWIKSAGYYESTVMAWKSTIAHISAHKLPYAKGDILWVKETWAENIPGCPGGITYRADHMDPKGDGPAHPVKWKPSIFMRRSISRINLLATNVRVERLNDISDNDALAEGIEPSTIGITHKTCFRVLWEEVNGPGSWKKNPMVWVIEFRRRGCWIVPKP